MKLAIISDIHGNLEALEAVLADIAAQSVQRIVCLGDVIGYGPNPRECLDIAMTFDLCILGNHDEAAIFSPDGFSSGAERAIFWTRSQLEQPTADPELAKRRFDFLMQRPWVFADENRLYVHGTPRQPLSEYLFPDDIHNSRKMERLFQLVPQYCFQGHTHVPGIFTPQGRFLAPRDIGGRWTLHNDKLLINVGSVGQPRDGDGRSCYVVLDGNRLEYRRVPYPLETTISKIHAIPELDPYLGDRLREGR